MYEAQMKHLVYVALCWIMSNATWLQSHNRLGPFLQSQSRLLHDLDVRVSLEGMASKQPCFFGGSVLLGVLSCISQTPIPRGTITMGEPTLDGGFHASSESQVEYCQVSMPIKWPIEGLRIPVPFSYHIVIYAAVAEIGCIEADCAQIHRQ